MYNVGEITEAVERLIWRGPLENRGKSGEESLCVETPDVIVSYGIINKQTAQIISSYGHKFES